MTQPQTQAEQLPSSLPEVSLDDFLPPIDSWLTLGGLVCLGIVGTGVAIAAVFNFDTVVKAPAIVRPVGDLRTVQAPVQGTVQTIWVEDNELVEAGQAIATLDDTQLQNQKQLKQSEMVASKQQLQHLALQQQQLEQQIAAERQRIAQSVRSATSELALTQRQFADQQVIAVAQVQAAQAEVELTQEELRRYRQLADSGAIAQIQIREREAAVATAQANLDEVQTAIDPSSASVSIAQERIAELRSSGDVTFAQLNQSLIALQQQQTDLVETIDSQRQELIQLDLELDQLIITAPTAGLIQSFTLRNQTQVVNQGETIAHIVPTDGALVVKSFVAAQDIAKVERHQPVQLQIDACPYPDYGTLEATVVAIAADVQTNPTTPQLLSPTSITPAYEVTIQPKVDYLQAGAKKCKIQIGMNVTTKIISHQDTVMRFLLRKVRLLN